MSGRRLVLCLLTAVMGGLSSAILDAAPLAVGATDSTPDTGNRIEWDQEAPSVSALDHYEFRVYVNGTEAAVSQVRCTAPSPALTFVCSGRLPPLPPGTHRITVAASNEGVDSPPSAPLTIVVPSAVPARAAAAESVSPVPTLPLCLSGLPHACFVMRQLAVTPRPISAPVVAPDGRLFVIEGGTAIRVFSGSTLQPAPALRAAVEGERLLQIAFDPSFETSRAVFVLSSDTTAQGHGDLTITRYRELQNQLGQGAVVVAGLSSGIGGALLTAGDDGLLYVTAEGDRDRPATGLLRFTSEGATPWTTGQVSPALARVSVHTTAMVFDPALHRMWLAGRDVNARAALQALDVDVPPGRATPSGVPPVSPSAEIVALTISEDAGAGRSLVSIDTTGLLQRWAIGDHGAVGLPQRLGVSGGRPTAIAAGPSGVLYLVTGQAVDDVPGSAVFTLIPTGIPAR